MDPSYPSAPPQDLSSPTVASIDTTTTTTENSPLMSDPDINTEIPDTSNDAALAAALAAQEAAATAAAAAPSNPVSTLGGAFATTLASSSPWQYDDLHDTCRNCHQEFHPILNRKHHCRYCGNIFCHKCSDKKALIPPSQIVLSPKGGRKARSDRPPNVSFTPDPDPDRMLTYVVAPSSSASLGSDHAQSPPLLYGKGLEERFQLAREPIRVCRSCYVALQPIQEELRLHNSHAMRFNHVDPTHPIRFFNSPLAFTLGHEIRKAAYALNNLLPQPKRRPGAIVPPSNNNNNLDITFQSEIQQCQEQCNGVSPNLGDLDGVRIPATLLERAKGVAVMTVIKGGFGLAGIEFGTGLVVARLPSDNGFRWSAPSAIGTAGVAFGALIGAQVSDHVFLLMTDAAVALLYSDKASVQLGADVGVAVGPLGRALEGDWGVDGTSAAPIYTYSLSKGLYAGISLDGKVIVTRDDVNEKFYGCRVSAPEILAGAVPSPPAAQPLYEALQRCHVYASSSSASSVVGKTTSRTMPPLPNDHNYNVGGESSIVAQEYGEWTRGLATMPSTVPNPPLYPGTGAMMGGPNNIHSATMDQKSVVSDITTDYAP